MIIMHPGEYLHMAYMEDNDMTATELAHKLDVSPSTVSRILSCKADVTPEMALRLEKVLDRSAESWLAMQTAHSLAALRSQQLTAA